MPSGVTKYFLNNTIAKMLQVNDLCTTKMSSIGLRGANWNPVHFFLLQFYSVLWSTLHEYQLYYRWSDLFFRNSKIK